MNEPTTATTTTATTRTPSDDRQNINRDEIKLDQIEHIEEDVTIVMPTAHGNHNKVTSQSSRKSSTISSKSIQHLSRGHNRSIKSKSLNGHGGASSSMGGDTMSLSNSNVRLRVNLINNNSRNNNNDSASMNSSNNETMGNGLATIVNSSTLVVKDPIVIRGAGNITIFGISNRFSEQFPTQLNAKLAPEEFRDTIRQINNILTKELSNSLKWLVFGSIFCCCTLGCSLLPVIFMNKKAKLSVNKLLEMENQRLYLKLGLKWKLTKIKYNANSLLEYVLLIEFLPTILLYQPD